MNLPIWIRFSFIFLCVVSAGFLFWGNIGDFKIPEFAISERATTGRILFVGDVMLSRYVESHMRERGALYPYSNTGQVFREFDQIVGNFEGSIPKKHVPTPAMAMRFSIDAVFAPALAEAGFTMMTLANNHAFDYGAGGLENTEHVLEKEGVTVAGHPNRTDYRDIEILTVQGTNVAIIPVHAVTQVDVEQVVGLIRDASLESDIQIITVHWGDEYEALANDYQRTLARAFIDAGADVIIGHHPHVMQQVEVYEGVPIFYSLGNFIFDQYWNNDVQEGLAVGIEVDKNRLVYHLLPVVSVASVPHFAEGAEKAALLDTLALRSDVYVAAGIRNGELAFDINMLATSKETAMIGTY